jgi:Sporulation and spore germination
MIPRHILIAACAMLALALGLSAYAWRMRTRVGQSESSVTYSHPIAPPAQGPTEQATLYVAHDNPPALRPQAATIPLPAGRQERAESLLRALLSLYLDPSSPHQIGPGAEIRSVYLVEPGLAVIDANAALADRHRSGILVEELTLTSLVTTLSANIPGIARVKILVEGKERDTLAGHADLSGFYDVSAINQLVTQLQ